MSLSANVFGAMLFGDLLPRFIFDETEDRYWQNIQEFVAEENKWLQQYISLLADTGTEVQTGYQSQVGGRMQNISETSGLESNRVGKRWFVGFPIYAKGTKETYTVPWLEEATFEDLAGTILNATLIDVETVMADMFNALLQPSANSPTGNAFDDSQWPGSRVQSGVNVYSLCNADGAAGSVYAYGQEVDIGGVQNYITNGVAGGNPDVNTFWTARQKLHTVGCDNDVVYIVSRNTADYCVRNLKPDFVEPVTLLNTNFRDPFGKYALVDSPRSRGRIAYGEVIEWPHFPDGYLLALDRSKNRPLRMRMHKMPKYQGLALANPNPNAAPDVQTNPLVGKQWRRIYGFGARNRVNGVVVQFTNAGSYTAPTPM